MDLYADLPLAKGAATTALDADGKLKSSSGSSVWTTTAAPAFVPQVVRSSANAPQQAVREKDVTETAAARPPPIATKSAASMLPAALRTKSPNATTTAPATTSTTTAGTGISLAFKPASITRKSPQPLASPRADTSATLNSAEPRTRGLGFGFAAVTTEVRIQQQPHHMNSAATTSASEKDASHKENDPSTASAVASSAGFFHASYRDEYNPARPNSYEAYCEERVAKKKLELVKRELDRRQREQEREGKLEREKLVRDIEAGTAPTAQLAAAGRGRGMTVPAWMRKKMEETAAAAAKPTEVPQQQPRNEHDRVDADQFEDAPPRSGLGFGAASRANASPLRASAGLGFVPSGRRSQDARGMSSNNNSSSTSGHEPIAHSGAAPVQSQQQRVQSARPSARGCVILLQNMVGPGEVDDELQDEVKEECEAKYGRVTTCVVYEVPTSARVPPEQAVRIFVQFERPGDAEKARLGLNARFFGGRKVHAALFDDDKFHLRDFSV